MSFIFRWYTLFGRLRIILRTNFASYRDTLQRFLMSIEYGFKIFNFLLIINSKLKSINLSEVKNE